MLVTTIAGIDVFKEILLSYRPLFRVPAGGIDRKGVAIKAGYTPALAVAAGSRVSVFVVHYALSFPAPPVSVRLSEKYRHKPALGHRRFAQSSLPSDAGMKMA